MYRLGATDVTNAVSYTVQDGSAQAGRDYLPAAGTLTFAPGQSVNYIPVTLLDNPKLDGDRTIIVQLSGPIGAALSVNADSAAVTITDNEVPFMMDPTFKARLDGAAGSVLVQPDGRIVVLVVSSAARTGLWRSDLIRLLSNGAPDDSFKAAVTFDGVVSIHLQRQGQIIVNTGTNLIRLNSDGSRDPAFTSTPPKAFDKVIVRHDDKIFGFSSENLVRLNADGTLDPSFAFSRTRDLGPPECGSFGPEFTVAPDGKPLVQASWCGTNADQLRLFRLNEDGSLDHTFDARFDLGPERASAGDYPNLRSLLAQPDGRLVVTGSFDFVNGAPRKGTVRLLGAAGRGRTGGSHGGSGSCRFR